jgi:hypothetical protein
MSFSHFSKSAKAAYILAVSSHRAIIEYGQSVRLLKDGDDEQWDQSFKGFSEGVLIHGAEGVIRVTVGHHRSHMDDDTTQAWGDDGDPIDCQCLYQPPQQAHCPVPALELWASNELGEMICIERLNWVEDCLQFVGSKSALGYFGDITIELIKPFVAPQLPDNESVETVEVDEWYGYP